MLNQTHPVHTFSLIYRNLIMILSFHLRLALPSGLFPFDFLSPYNEPQCYLTISLYIFQVRIFQEVFQPAFPVTSILATSPAYCSLQVSLCQQHWMTCINHTVLRCVISSVYSLNRQLILNIQTFQKYEHTYKINVLLLGSRV